jgi:hypothetical protein
MSKAPIKPEPLLNLSIAERETLIAARQAASTDTRLSPLSQATAAKCVQQLRWIQHKRIQQLCAALGANCEASAVHRADGPASQHEVAIDRAWDVLISATAKKLGWDGEPTARAIGRKAFSIADPAERAEMYRKSGLIRALEIHRPSPLDDGAMFSTLKGDLDAAGMTTTVQQAQHTGLPLDLATQLASGPQAQASAATAAPPATTAPLENPPVHGAPEAPSIQPMPVDLFHSPRPADALPTPPSTETPAKPISTSTGAAPPPTCDGTKAAIKAWDGAIVSAAMNLGWEGEPTSQAMNLKALLTPKGASKIELHRNSWLIKAMEEQRGTAFQNVHGAFDAQQAAFEKAWAATLEAFDKSWDSVIASYAKKLSWEGDPTSKAMFAQAFNMAEGPAKAEMMRNARLIREREELRVTPFHDRNASREPQHTTHRETTPMKKTRQWPSVRTAAIIAVMLAMASFFLMADYHVQWSVIVNVMKGHIFGEVPYRWVLAALATFVGVVALKRPKP